MRYTALFIISVCLLSQTLAKQSLAQDEEDKFPKFDVSLLDYKVLTNTYDVELVAIENAGSGSFQVRNNNIVGLKVTDPSVCAVIKYQRKLKEIGWDIMYLETSRVFSPENQMACAGFLEGLASQEGIGYWFNNQDSEHSRTPAEYKKFFDNVYENMFHKIKKAKTQEENLFWQTARLLYIQLIGVKHGHNALLPKHVKEIEMWQLSLSNISGQEEELDAIIKYSTTKKATTPTTSSLIERLLLKGSITDMNSLEIDNVEPVNVNDEEDDDDITMRKSRCSVFFKLLSEDKTYLQDVIASHSTWEGYSYMNRIYKFYSLPTLSGPSRQIQMSSYPGAITSTDDYFVKEGMFLVTETSIAPLNNKIFKKLNAKDVDIPDFMRTMASLHLAQTGKEWTDSMSGFGKVKMYSSEWMVLDFQNLKKSSRIPENTFLVFTSSFELQRVEDFTQKLIDDTFYASFNYPELKEAQVYLGYTKAVEKGTYYPIEKDPRYEIFQFFEQRASNITEVQWLMQYNQYKQPIIPGEPVFKSPKDAIGSRWDLTHKNPAAYGETDAKVVNLDLLKEFSVLAISGPSHQEQPVFSWATWKDDDKHEGQPDIWNFDWQYLQPRYSSGNY